MKANKIKIFDSSFNLRLELSEKDNAEYDEDEKEYVIYFESKGIRWECVINKDHIGMLMVGDEK